MNLLLWTQLNPWWNKGYQFSSVAQSCLTLRLHGLQHSRLRCPSPSPGVFSDSCPLSQWCHPTISSSVIPFSSCFQSFPASWSSNESILCIKWSKYWSFNFSISPSNEYSGLISFRIDWLDLLAAQGTLKSSPTPQFKRDISTCDKGFWYPKGDNLPWNQYEHSHNRELHLYCKIRLNFLFIVRIQK